MRAFRHGWVVVLVLLLCCGCGRKGPKTFPVSGTVYLNDKPLADVSVRFFTDQYAGFGTTDAQGHYSLEAVAGDNGVIFVKAPALTGKDDGGVSQAPGGFKVTPKKPVKDELPAEYTDASKPKERFNVPSGGSTSADFRLKGPAQ